MTKIISLPNEDISKMYSEGKSFREIGRIFNYDSSTIKKRLIYLKVNLRSRKEQMKISCNNSERNIKISLSKKGKKI